MVNSHRIRLAKTAIYFLLLCFSLISFSLLNGCSTTHRDGPPNFYVDEKRVPDAVPKVEPLSRIGNKPFYYVRGKRYYVMSSSKHYDEIGTASWYGTMFHKHHTSNGERYDMLAMTAAHKTLPLPTYVEVTNLKNHRKVIVKVNDRGPFEAGRLIDLSYVAAKKLGMLGHGTARVRVKAIDPVEYAANHHSTSPWQALFAQNNPAKHNQSANRSSVYVQVGAFRKRLYAEHLKNRILRVTSSPVLITQSENLYQVKVGPLEDRQAARQMTRKLHVYGLI